MLKLILFLSLFCITTLNCYCLQAQTAVIDAIDKYLIPLKTLQPDSDYSDLERLKSVLKDKPVIGIGEATHGTHEFFLFKHRMLEFLVKEMGVKVFVMEGDFAGTQVMNDYVGNGHGDVKKGLWNIGFGVWMTQEVVDMCNWIKKYNDKQAPENKVRFFGCDMQWGWSAMEQLKAYLSPLGLFSPAMEAALKALKTPPPVKNTDKEIIRAAVETLTSMKFDLNDTALYRHDVRELQQYLKLLDLKSTFFPARGSDWRDKCMAENCEWIYNYTSHRRMMVWAHNGHIGKSSNGFKRMGMYLSADLGNSYYAMGFDFYEGQMRSFDMREGKYVSAQLPPSKPGSTGAFFSQCSYPSFIIDIKTVSENDNSAKDFFGQLIPSMAWDQYLVPR